MHNSLIACDKFCYFLFTRNDRFQCVLASVVVVALKGMLMQTKEFFTFWKLSRLDAGVWMVTFLTVVIFSIDIGLLVGIILSLACIFIRGMKPYTCLLGHIPKTDLYLDINRYKAVSKSRGLGLDLSNHFNHSCSIHNFAGRRAQFNQNIPLLWQSEFRIA